MTNPNDLINGESGLTKREYFAAMALQGLMAAKGVSMKDGAKWAVQTADMFINNLNKSQEDLDKDERGLMAY